MHLSRKTGQRERKRQALQHNKQAMHFKCASIRAASRLRQVKRASRQRTRTRTPHKVNDASTAKRHPGMRAVTETHPHSEPHALLLSCLKQSVSTLTHRRQTHDTLRHHQNSPRRVLEDEDRGRIGIWLQGRASERVAKAVKERRAVTPRRAQPPTYPYDTLRGRDARPFTGSSAAQLS